MTDQKKACHKFEEDDRVEIVSVGDVRHTNNARVAQPDRYLYARGRITFCDRDLGRFTVLLDEVVWQDREEQGRKGSRHRLNEAPIAEFETGTRAVVVRSWAMRIVPVVDLLADLDKPPT